MEELREELRQIHRLTRCAWLLPPLLAACAEERGAPLPASTPGPAQPAAGDLIEEARARGVDYVNRSGGAAKETILEANGAGVALLDLERDGDLDLCFAQGLPSLAALAEGPGADLELFRNDGRGRFTRGAGPGLAGWWTALASGDLDSDGDADLVAGGYGGLWVLLQDEQGRLVPTHDLGRELGLVGIEPGALLEGSPPPSWISALCLLDFDRDGRLDLYVGRYLDLDPLAPPREKLGQGALAVPCTFKGHPVYCGPRGLVPQADLLLRGRGDGGFTDETGARLPEHEPGYTLAACAFDAEGDGDRDLYVATDSTPNRLFLNEGDGRFVERGWEANVALGMEGKAEAGMGIAIGDLDRDGRLDLAVTNFSEEPTEIFLGADLGFANASYRSGLASLTRRLLSWSAHLCDFDGDGRLELFTANGHVYPQADLPGTGTSYAQPATLFAFDERLRARRVEPASAGSLLTLERGTRGAAVGDLDRDGAPDLVCVAIDGPALLGMNRYRSGHRLVVRCQGEGPGGTLAHRSPLDALGTRVVLVHTSAAGPVGQLAELHTSEGYQSASAPELYFGLGEARGYDELRVAWPSGRVERLPGGPADRRILLREGEGLVAEEALP